MAAEKRRIGRLEVSLVGLGCNNFGRRLDALGTKKVVEAALAGGITHFDTAAGYGGGRSERLVGEFLKGQRDGVQHDQPEGDDNEDPQSGQDRVYGEFGHQQVTTSEPNTNPSESFRRRSVCRSVPSTL